MAVALFLVFLSTILLVWPQSAGQVLAWLAPEPSVMEASSSALPRLTMGASIGLSAGRPLPKLAEPVSPAYARLPPGAGSSEHAGETAAELGLAAPPRPAPPETPAAEAMAGGLVQMSPGTESDPSQWNGQGLALSFEDELVLPGSKPSPPRRAAVSGTPARMTVQVGSFRRESDAETEWKRLQRRYPALFGSRTGRVERVDLADRGTYYRVLADAETAGEAYDLCRSMKALGLDCLVLRLSSDRS